MAAVSCFAVLPVSIVHNKTARRVADGWNGMVTTAIRQIVPDGVAAVEKKVQSEHDSITYWLATSRSDTIYCFTVDTYRYPGNITFVVGIGTDGVVKGMSTVGGAVPGCIGDLRKAVFKRGTPEEKLKNKRSSQLWFTEQFVGLSASRLITVSKTTGQWCLLDEPRRNELREKNEITAITGATRSTCDIANAVTYKARRLLKTIRS